MRDLILPAEDYKLKLRFFGGLELENSKGKLCENLQRPSLSWQLLKLLLLNRGRTVDVEEVQEKLLHGEADTNGTLLRVRLRRLRDALEPIGIGGVRHGLVLYSYGKYSINTDFELEVDEDEYRALSQRLHSMALEDPEGPGVCLRALELQRGPYMGDRGDEEWLRPYREHYRREFVFLAYNTLSRMKLLGDNCALETLCQRAVELAPEEEVLHKAVISYLVEQRRELELIRYIAGLSRSTEAQIWLKELGY